MANDRYYDATVPLFGDDSTQVRTMDLGVGVVTVIAVLITLGICFMKVESHNQIDVFFGVVLILLTIPQVVLVVWFRRGDLHPKFRYLITYMMFAIMMLCACGIAYVFHYKNLCS